jgi:bifunctional non-homologous end joining protein LigD
MKQGISSKFSFVEPVKARPVRRLPEGDWLYEVKFDGYQALAFKNGKDVRLISRKNKDSQLCPTARCLKIVAD